jgi:hypothetical protein
MPGATYVLASPEDMLEDAVMRGAGEEMLDRVAQIIEGLQQLKREGDERHEAMLGMLQAQHMQDTLEHHSRAFEALHGTFKGAVLGKIWFRALVITGTAWGMLGAALYGYFRGWPF